MQVSPAWRDRLAAVGALATCVVAARVARVLWLRAQLSLGPVQVARKYKWALVTGGSEGIGKAIAMSLAKHGLNVVLVSRSQEKLDAAQRDIHEQYPEVQVRTVACDVSKAAECRKLLQKLDRTPISCLVANAGGGVKSFAHYWTYTDEEEAHVHGLNGTSCTTLVRGLLPGMMERGSGAIVAISSIMGKFGAMAAPYGGEKARLNAIMSSLDAELKIVGSPVTAQAMVIGGVLTPATLKLMRPELKSASPAAVAAALQEAGPGRKMFTMAPASDVGEAIVRAIGKGGPVVTPYWKHALSEALLLDVWWPPSLGRAMQRKWTRNMTARLRDLQAQSGAK